MKSNGKRGEQKNGEKLFGVIGLTEIQSLNSLLKIYYEYSDAKSIPIKLITDVIARELSSDIYTSFLKSLPNDIPDDVDLKEFSALQKNIPDKLYYFLWSLKNSDIIPTKGILNSLELRKSIYSLVKFIIILEHYFKKYQTNIALLEALGLAYLDVAGIVFYTRYGILINGCLQDHTQLLRKAILCFQKAIRQSALQGKEIDIHHKEIFLSIDENYDVDDKRINLFLDPWHFLYISSALRTLNDHTVAALYLKKARTVINNIDDHQNPRIVTQKELLESVYTTINMGEKVKFSFGSSSLVKLQQKINRIRKYKNEKIVRNCYSPIVEDALNKQLQVQTEMILTGQLQTEQKVYLRGVYTLYKQTLSTLDRDKLIFRLDIPPIKINGRLKNRQTHLLEEKKKQTPLKLVSSNQYRKAS